MLQEYTVTVTMKNTSLQAIYVNTPWYKSVIPTEYFSAQENVLESIEGFENYENPRGLLFIDIDTGQ